MICYRIGVLCWIFYPNNDKQYTEKHDLFSYVIQEYNLSK